MKTSISALELTANTLRRDISDIAYLAEGTSHPGPSLSYVDIIAALYFCIMSIDPQHPE